MLNLNDLEQQIVTHMEAARVPGLAIAVVQGNQITYARGFGVADTQTNTPITPETVFRIGSVTKPLTATMLMRLVEQGLLNLDTPITEYVPWLHVFKTNLAGQLTLRMLLSHTAGLPTALEYKGSRDPRGLESYVREFLPALTPVAPPGLVYSYSNPGINLAGYIAEAIAGKPYPQLMHELVFEPLNMRRTTFDPLEAMTYPFSQSFVLDANGNPQVRRPFIDNTGEYPCGFAMSTVLDLANFAMLHINSGRFGDQQLLQPQTIAEMHTPAVKLQMPGRRGYGIGFRVNDYGWVFIEHNGAIAKYGAVFSTMPEEKRAIVLLFNRGPNFWNAAAKIANQVIFPELNQYSERHLLKLDHDEPDVLPSYVGTYLGTSTGLVTVKLLPHQWPVMEWNGVEYILSPTGIGTYRFKEGGIGFVHNDGETVQYVMMNSMLCARFDDYNPNFTPDWAIWQTYAGEYRGDTDSWKIAITENAISIYCEDEGYTKPAIPINSTRFACDFGTFEFILDAQGRAVALMNGLYRFDRVS